MKQIQLTKGKVTIVDDEDYEYLSQWKWYAKNMKGKWYAYRSQKTYPMSVPMHIEICKPVKGMVVDHKNGDGLDNQRSNLRVCTQSQNSMNRPRFERNISGYKGVCLKNSTGKWVAQIAVNKRNIHLGYFTTKEEAARAYDEAAKRLHGEFARTNF